MPAASLEYAHMGDSMLTFRNVFRHSAWAAFLAVTPVGLAAAQTAFQPIDWKLVDQVLGRSGAAQPGDVYKFGFPRGDLRVTVGQVVVKPALALGSWLAFKQTGDTEAVVMGDLVLLESEVSGVMRKLQEGGIAPVALHNHLLHDSPHVLYMHIAGRGAPVKLATTLRAALGATQTPLGPPPAPPSAPAALDFDTAQVAGVLGFHGKVNGGVYQVAVPRADGVTMQGVEVPPAMGTATALNFQPTGPGTAAVTGDFVMIAGEVDRVERALQANGIEVTALHSHMLEESPRLFFMHFWGTGDAVTLARGLRAALDQMSLKR